MPPHSTPHIPHSTFLHVDINSYFATMLQQENPQLRGKPVGVVKDEGRTCIIAASKEAKKLGVQTGSRVADARELIPDLITVPAHFDLYLHATKQLQKIFTSFSPDLNIFSLDEAFLNLTHCQTYLYKNPHNIAQQIKQTIKKELGDWVTCNIGISYTKLLAKIASEISPKDSIFEITHENRDAVLSTVSFRDVCGVGYRLEKKLKMIGATTPYLIRLCSDQELLQQVGPFWLKELRKISYGEDPQFLCSLDSSQSIIPQNSRRETWLNKPRSETVLSEGGIHLLDTQTQMKSVGRSITGYALENNEHAIKRVLYNLIEEVTYKVRKMHLVGRHVSIGISGHDRSWFAHKTVQFPIRHTQEMFDVAYHQLYHHWQRTFPVIKYWVRLDKLQSELSIPESLLPSWQKQKMLSTAIDKVSEKYGLFTVKSGLLLQGDVIRPEVTGFLGDKIYQLTIR